MAGTRWRDLDLEQSVWTLPRELTKSDRAHVVPLAEPVVEIIKGLPRLGELVFPAQRAGSANPVSGFSRVKARLDERMAELLNEAATENAKIPRRPS